MLKLFIADDNMYERNGIKDSINWEELDIEVAGVFSDGLEVMDKLKEQKPDIIITDIAMPEMNGIEMAAKIRKDYPDIKIIFISCHSDFEFARSAIDLGVYSYVLKPIVADDLKKAVEKLMNELRLQQFQSEEKEKMLKQMEDMLPLVQEQFFKELLLGNYRNVNEIKNRMSFLKIHIEDNSSIHVVSIDANKADESIPDKNISDSYLMSYSIKNIILSFNTDTRRIFAVQISESRFAAIIFNKERPLLNGSYEFDNKDCVLNTAVEINMEISRRLLMNTTMGVSKSSFSPVDISRLYKQSCAASDTRFYSGSNPIILFEEIEDNSENTFTEIPDMELVYQDIKAVISFGSDQDIKDFIDKYLSHEGLRLDENYIKSFTYSLINITGIVLSETNQSFKDIFGDEMLIWKKLSRFDSIGDVKQWIFNIFKAVKEYLTDKNSSRNMKMVDAIKDFIRNMYKRQFSMEDISKQVHLSGRHANSLFKKETGKTIFDYLIEYRMEKAKMLLKEPDSKVSAVAEAVGYMNTSYFCLAFKKNTGVTPAEYKSRFVI